MKTLYPFEKIKTCFLNHLHYTCQASHTVPSFKEKLIRKVPSPAFPFWLFSSFSFHSFADGGSFSADSSRIRLFSKRFSKRICSWCSWGPETWTRGMHFSVQLSHEQWRQFPIQTLLHYSSPGEYWNYLYHSSVNTFYCVLFTLKVFRNTSCMTRLISQTF